MYALSARYCGPHSSSIKTSILNWHDRLLYTFSRSSELIPASSSVPSTIDDGALLYICSMNVTLLTRANYLTIIRAMTIYVRLSDIIIPH